MSEITDIYEPSSGNVSKAHIKNPTLLGHTNKFGYSKLTILSPYVKDGMRSINLGLRGKYYFLNEKNEKRGLATEIHTDLGFSFILGRKDVELTFGEGSDLFFVNVPKYKGRTKMIKSKHLDIWFNSNSKLFTCPEIGVGNVGMNSVRGIIYVFNQDKRKLEELEMPGCDNTRTFTKYQDVMCMYSYLKKEDFLTMGRHKNFSTDLYAKLIQIISKSDLDIIETYVSLDNKVAGVCKGLKYLFAPEFQGSEGLLEKWV